MVEDLAGKVAIVTGGSRGIGRAIAQRLATEGADCLIVARTAEDLETASGELTADTGRRIETCAVDLRSLEGCGAVHRRLQDAVGGVDILVNCASGPRADG